MESAWRLCRRRARDTSTSSSASLQDGLLTDVHQLTPENVSSLPRYYYSKVDHEISPVWTKDGSEIFVHLESRPYPRQTGVFWKIKTGSGAEAHEIHYEETNWKARPDFSPDGKRMCTRRIWGRTGTNSGSCPRQVDDAFPISYGAFDNVNPRWSPDGSKDRVHLQSKWQHFPMGANNSRWRAN